MRAANANRNAGPIQRGRVTQHNTAKAEVLLVNRVEG